jgi:hypothetical protein
MDIDRVARHGDGIREAAAVQDIVPVHHVLADDQPRLANAQERRGRCKVSVLEARHVRDQVLLYIGNLPARLELAHREAACVGGIHPFNTRHVHPTSPALKPVIKMVRSVGIDNPACCAFWIATSSRPR